MLPSSDKPLSLTVHSESVFIVIRIINELILNLGQRRWYLVFLNRRDLLVHPNVWYGLILIGLFIIVWVLNHRSIDQVLTVVLNVCVHLILTNRKIL